VTETVSPIVMWEKSPVYSEIIERWNGELTIEGQASVEQPTVSERLHRGPQPTMMSVGPTFTQRAKNLSCWVEFLERKQEL
jgi:hypothetical protein